MGDLENSKQYTKIRSDFSEKSQATLVFSQEPGVCVKVPLCQYKRSTTTVQNYALRTQCCTAMLGICLPSHPGGVCHRHPNTRHFLQMHHLAS